MPATRTALQAMADLLVAAEINATCDPAACAPPCVLIPPPLVETPSMCGSIITASLWVLVPSPLSLAAWDGIDALVGQVVTVLDGSEYAWTSINRNLVYTLDPIGPNPKLYPAAEIVLAPYPIAN